MDHTDFNKTSFTGMPPITNSEPDVGDKFRHSLHSFMDVIKFLLDVKTRAQLIHWSTYKFSTHIAMGEFYDGIDDLLDELAEIMMGTTTNFSVETQEPETFRLPSTPVEFMFFVKQALMTAKGLFDSEPGLSNKFDEIIGLIDRTKYKLERLVS